MLKKLMALGALSAALTVGASATPAHADVDYSEGQLPTKTVIDIDAGAAGDPVTLFVSATANYDTPPEGDIAVKLLAASGNARGGRAVAAAPLLTTTVHFVDEPVAIEAGSLPAGRYIVTAAFTPDDRGFFGDSANTRRFTLGAGEAGGDEDGDGGLPNTGGPNMMWLLFGGGLVAAGAGGVTYARRRDDATA